MAAELHPRDADNRSLEAAALLASEGVKATPMLYSPRTLEDARRSGRPENRIICMPKQARQVRWMVTESGMLPPSDDFYESHGFDAATREAVALGHPEEVLRARRARLIELEAQHVESIGLTYDLEPGSRGSRVNVATDTVPRRARGHPLGRGYHRLGLGLLVGGRGGVVDVATACRVRHSSACTCCRFRMGTDRCDRSSAAR
jgi:hypothetical protein